MDPPRQRLRYDGLEHDTTPDGRCRVTVRLEWCGRTVEGRGEALDTKHGRVRAAADASLEAAVAAAGKRIHLEMIGVKAVRAFDGWVVVVSVVAEAGARTGRLLGASSTEDEDGIERAAALAVLDATNRVLEQYLGR